MGYRIGLGCVLAFALWPTLSWAGDGVPVSSITTIRSAPVATGPITDGARQVFYGAGDNVQMTSATIGGITVTRSAISKPNIAIRRIDNASVSGNRLTFFYPGTVTNTRIDVEGEQAFSMEQAMNDDYITSGGLDVFLNVDTGVEEANNIERIDFVVPAGINLPSTPGLLSEIGTIANEKHGNNNYKIAMITALDAMGNPSTFGPLRQVQGNVDYGNLGRPEDSSGAQLRNLYFRNAKTPTGATNGPVSYVRSDTNFIGMSFLSFAALGATPSQTVYGYAIFPNDVTAGNDLVGLTDVPLNTSGSANGGDIYGGTFAVFTTPAAEAQTSSGGTPVLAGSKGVSSAIPSAFHIPGEDVFYDITISNTGDGSPDADSILIIDPLPSELSFFNGDPDGTGPATDPVIFADAGSGLSFNYTTDVAYSNAATAPINFTDCSYTPATGYDPTVTHICVRPTGTLANGSSSPGFTLTFRARID